MSVPNLSRTLVNAALIAAILASAVGLSLTLMPPSGPVWVIYLPIIVLFSLALSAMLTLLQIRIPVRVLLAAAMGCMALLGTFHHLAK